MTTSAALDQQVQEDQERHDLLEKLAAVKGLEFDQGQSLDGLRELYATFGPDANAQVQPRELDAETDSDETDDDDAPKPDPDGKALFDSSDYEREDLQIAKIDGNQIDRIAIKFAGEVFLDRSSPESVALYNKLKLGQDVTLMVEAKCSATGAKGATDREGDLDVVVGQRAVKVHTVYIPAGDYSLGE